jgi:hypothetical protein
MVSNTLPGKGHERKAQDQNALLSMVSRWRGYLWSTPEKIGQPLPMSSSTLVVAVVRLTELKCIIGDGYHLAGIADKAGTAESEADGVQHASRSERHGRQPKQSANASLPMVFTLVGMAIDGRSRFAKKAESPMDSHAPPPSNGN